MFVMYDGKYLNFGCLGDYLYVFVCRVESVAMFEKGRNGEKTD